jgi:hypothetical protein
VSTVYLLPDDPAYDAIGFDVTTMESHEESSTVTENPIEDGSLIIDHILHAPNTFSFEAIVTERGIRPDFYGNADYAPYDTPAPEFRGFGVIIPTTLKVTVLQWAKGSRILEMQERLTRMRLDGITSTILTSVRPYDRMLITSIALPRESLKKGEGRFSISMRELVTVTTATVQAPQPKEPRAVPKVDKGSQGPGFFDKAFGPGAESILLNGAKSVFGPNVLQ